MLLQEAPKYNKIWLVVPALAPIKTDRYKLDWEAQNAKWFTKSEIKGLKLLPGFKEVLNQFFPLSD